MKILLLSRTTVIWLILFTATIMSWEMGHGFGFANYQHASVAIMVIAFIKVRFVILDFMEIRNAPHFMRIAGEIWLIAICSTLVILYFKIRGLP